MKKQEIAIRTRNGIVKVEGYVERGIGIHKVNGSKTLWTCSDLATGLGATMGNYKTRKEAVEVGVPEALKAIEKVKVSRPESYKDYVLAFNKLMGKEDKAEVKTESEGKTMAKTNTAPKAKRTNYKAENEALKREIEILKKQIEGLTKVEKQTIDTFDVEGYMAKREDTNRITKELVEALENTEGLIVSREGKDAWLFVKGVNEDATRSRKDIFKAMSFKWSANHNAWILAPYPIRSKKAWGAKKARKAMATA